MVGDNPNGHRDPEAAPGTENSTARLARILAPIGAELPAKIAPQLLAEFGSIGGIIDASEEHLRRLLGQNHRLVDAFLVCRSLLIEGLKEEVRRAPLRPDDLKLHRYLIAKIGASRDEKIIALFGNANREFICSDLIAQGDEASIKLSARRLFSRALALDARCLILAHNHPSGCAEPSRQDVKATLSIGKQALDLNIHLLDHVVVSRTKATSMLQRGLL